MLFNYQEKEFKFTRYPETNNRSLRAWSAAEEYVLLKLEELDLSSKTIAVYNDRFGFLSCTLSHHQPLVVIDRKSQQKAIEKNLIANSLDWDSAQQISPFSEFQDSVDIGIISIPKTLDLFRFYLAHLTQSLIDDGLVICSFMTKYFSPQMLSIAEEFFEDVEQSQARKKSRLLILKKKKPDTTIPDINSMIFSFGDGNEEELKQYAGVFSGDHIDYATQFLIEHLKLNEDDQIILDLASGNGVIARAVQLKKPKVKIHLVDDFLLAIESSRLNLDAENTQFHWNDTLEDFGEEAFDLALSNPPFHFAYETNIEVSIKLFHEASKALKQGGRFICVANQHLNYKTHLEKIFKTVEVLAQNDKFILYQNTQ